MNFTWAIFLAVMFVPSGSWAEAEREISSVPFSLTPVLTQGLQAPLYVTHAADGSGRLFLVEQAGVIRVLERGRLNGDPFLDIRGRVLSKGYEQGLLGLAFHPEYRSNGRFFVNYTRREDGATVLAEFTRAEDGRTAMPSSERLLMVVPQPYANHNGGMVAFGPDGYLYIGRGDGGSGGDPQNRAQNLQELLGKVLRIDVDHERPYAVPADNPFAKGGGKPEIFALGLRNPWRFSFDLATGELWLADVGQHKWEEVDIVTRGGNYGWRLMEGRHCFKPEEQCSTTGLIPPVAEYGHEQGRCSITGGYVYRGRRVTALAGWYLFGDFCSGELFAIDTAGDRNSMKAPRVVMKTGLRIASFGEDETGELYLVDHGGGLYRLDLPAPHPLP